MNAAQGPPGTYPGNHLIREKSPYLLQHAFNPVDWHPWGDEAFAIARRTNKLIFLSIGYSTCHWCHVMAHESFEDEAVAAALEKNYVAVKVDREERPDIDQVYMEFCQRLTGRGGWPLTVILTPDGLPVFAATYLPKQPRPGYAGLIELLNQVAKQAQEQRQKLRTSIQQLIQEMQLQTNFNPELGLDDSLLRRAGDELQQTYDSDHGGFGDAPKFPAPHNLALLGQRWRATGANSLLKIIEHTLIAMRNGGIYDHLGGGFHRYATDTGWLLPHFEKMLYDQAGLAEIYLEVYSLTGKQLYADTAAATLNYLLTDLANPDGGFHAAEDADTEGEEGRFYLWSMAEITQILADQDAQLFCRAYDIKEAGNYRDESTHALTGVNVLHRPMSIEKLAQQANMPLEELEERLTASRHRLLAQRNRRPRPHRDDKVLTAWNGMAIAALAKGARRLSVPAHLEAAQQAARFILSHLVREDGRLLRRWREGEAAIPGFAEDYAFFARGLLELYRTDFDPLWLKTALHLGEELCRLFSPDQGGALFDTGSDAESLVTRPRTLYDGAVISANAVALELFSRLYLLTGGVTWRTRAEQIISHLAPLAARHPSAFSGFLLAASLLQEQSRQAVVVGDLLSEDTSQLISALNTHDAPGLMVLHKPPQSDQLDIIAPYTRDMICQGDKVTVYLCTGNVCQQPTTNIEELVTLLGS